MSVHGSTSPSPPVPTSDELIDQPPQDVYATLLSRRVDLASIRTFYRILAAFGESQERRVQRTPIQHATPTRLATAPNQVGSGDITLTVHADRGSAMRSEGLSRLLGSVGVVRSFSHPHVSDDNAVSESQLKTLTYPPDSWSALPRSRMHVRA